MPCVRNSVFEEKMLLSRRFDVLSIHLSTKHSGRSPIGLWYIHPVPIFINVRHSCADISKSETSGANCRR